MAELKKCPFCGGDCLYKTFEVNDLGDEIPVIFCNWCKVVFKVENDSPFLNCKDTYEYLEEKNIKAWNNRATESEDIPVIHGKAELELHDKVVRAKAIDEFAEKLKGLVSEDGTLYEEYIDEIAEQLKEE